MFKVNNKDTNITNVNVNSSCITELVLLIKINESTKYGSFFIFFRSFKLLIYRDYAQMIVAVPCHRISFMVLSEISFNVVKIEN